MGFLLHYQIVEISVCATIIYRAQYWQERAVTRIVQETRGMRPEAHQQWNPSVQWAVEGYLLETLGAHLVTGKLTVARAGEGPWTRGPPTGEWLWVYTLMIFDDYKRIVIVAGMNIGSCSKCIFFKTWIYLHLISSFRVNKRHDCCVLSVPTRHDCCVLSVPTTAFCAFRVFLLLGHTCACNVMHRHPCMCSALSYAAVLYKVWHKCDDSCNIYI